MLPGSRLRMRLVCERRSLIQCVANQSLPHPASRISPIVRSGSHDTRHCLFGKHVRTRYSDVLRRAEATKVKPQSTQSPFPSCARPRQRRAPRRLPLRPSRCSLLPTSPSTKKPSSASSNSSAILEVPPRVPEGVSRAVRTRQGRRGFWLFAQVRGVGADGPLGILLPGLLSLRLVVLPRCGGTAPAHTLDVHVSFAMFARRP